MNKAIVKVAVGKLVFHVFDSVLENREAYRFLDSAGRELPNARQIQVHVGDLNTSAMPESALVSVLSDENTINIEKRNSFQAIYDKANYSVELRVSPVLQKADSFSRAIVVSSITRILAAELLRSDGVMLFHGSSVVSHGGAHLFVGESGAGKSTICMLAENRELLADEISIATSESGFYRLEPSPFVSDRNLPRRAEQAFRLASINLLEQSTDDERIKIPPRDAIALVMKNLLHFSRETNEHMLALDNIVSLVESVPVFSLKFTLSTRFWNLID